MVNSDITVMRGPNMWSAVYNKLIVIKYDPVAVPEIHPLQQHAMAEYFRENKKPHIFRSDDYNISVFQYILHLTATLQDSLLYCDTISPSPGIIYGLVEYSNEEAGLEALNVAFQVVRKDPSDFAKAQKAVQDVIKKNNEGPTTAMIIEAAKKRNIPVNKGPAGYIVLGYGKRQKRISAAISHQTTCIAVNIAGDKDDTKIFLESAGLPVPSGQLIRDESELQSLIERIGYPLVTKPYNGNQGKNVTCGIATYDELINGFRTAAEMSKSVMVEREIKGNDYRLLVVGNRFIAASLRQPAFIIGDGLSTIAQLVEKENENPLRGEGHENILTKIKMDAVTEIHLQKLGYNNESVPIEGQQIFLRSTANLSTGGIAEDVTDSIHSSNKLIAERVSKIIGLDICGIDVISPDISKPLRENGGAIIEVNAAPGLRMHKFPSKGCSREVAEPIINLMFQGEDQGRIPIVAVTGTNGKTSTTRLMAHIADFVGYTVGFSSTDGIYVGGENIKNGDCSGPQSAKMILQDPTVDFAVLECARGGIIRSGLGFDQCDIAIVTNVAADHLGLKDIYTIEDLANVKVVVPRSVKKDGWSILNAGDEYSYGMKDKLGCNIALFCSDVANRNLQKHIENGGHAVYTDKLNDVYIYDGAKNNFVFNAGEAPVTRQGKATFMTENMLPVILASYLSGISFAKIVEALKSFIPDKNQTPGRITEFRINGVNVIVDYAHNPHGLRALAGYLKNIFEKKLGIIAVPGDRRDDDIVEFGRIAGEMYDDIIIRFDRDTRGRSEQSIVTLLAQGINSSKPDLSFKVIADTETAIQYAVENAPKGSYIVICADNAIYTLGLTEKVAAKFKNT